MLRVLFWNLGKKDLRRLLCDAASSLAADVIIVIENPITASVTLDALKSQVAQDFRYPATIPDRFQVFSRNAALDLNAIHTTERFSCRRLAYSETQLMLGVVHLVDKMNYDQAHQSAEAQLLAQNIHRLEDAQEHSRTILIGDFNMNPFDGAMNMIFGMNSLMTADCVSPGSRSREGKEYRFFYNPMWSLFGDRTPGPAGTFYHQVSTRGHYGWNMLDQVLIRPDALPWFDSVEIVATAGTTSLETKRKRPNATLASDHFPILLKLK